MSDQENIKRIQEREAEWAEIYSEMAEGSGEPPISPEKVEQKNDMAQVLHHLKGSLAEDRKSLNYMQNVEIEHRDEDIFKGRIEALEYAIKQIEDSMYEEVQVTKHMSIKEKRDDAKTAVNTLRDYLITGKRGTHGTEESN